MEAAEGDGEGDGTSKRCTGSLGSVHSVIQSVLVVLVIMALIEVAVMVILASEIVTAAVGVVMNF